MPAPQVAPDLLVHQQEPYNAEPRPAALAGRPLTPVGVFYVRNHGPVPDIEPGEWRLRVDGLVDRVLELDLATLRQTATSITRSATLQCAGNRRADLLEVADIPGEAPWGPGATSTATWTGVRLADVLGAAGVLPGAAHVVFTAPDHAADADPPQTYGSSIPLDKATAPEVLLAWGMNGEPLPPAHGGPVRMVVPGYIGARSVKWVHRVTVQTAPSDSYFQAAAYRLVPADARPARGAGLPLGQVALNCAVLTPQGGATVPPGPTTVSGYAMAGCGRTVGRVDVSTDGGRTWCQAAFDTDEATSFVWRLWSVEVDLPGGPAEVVARAWDSSGSTHPESASTVWNPKGYVNNSWPRVRFTVAG